MNYNYYTVLGVSQNATAKEIKLAYKQKAIAYHPDKNRGLVYYEEQFKLINEAYQVLKDTRKRAVYDLKLYYLRQQQQLLKQQQEQQMRYQQTRRPAPVSERYYHTRPRIRKFSKRDYLIVAVIFTIIISISLMLKVVMDHVTGTDKYKAAQTYIHTQKWSAAHSFLSEAIYFKPDMAEAYHDRADIEFSIYQNYGAALSDLDNYIELADEVAPDAYYKRGKSNFEMGNYQAAEQDYSKSIRLNTELPVAFFERGEVRLLYLDKFPEAAADFTSFLQTGNPAYNKRSQALMYRGFAHHLQKQYPLAITDFEQALIADPSNIRIYYLWGKTESALGDIAKACEFYVRAYNEGYHAARGDIIEQCRPWIHYSPRGTIQE